MKKLSILFIFSLLLSCNKSTTISANADGKSSSESTNCTLWLENSSEHAPHFRGQIVDHGTIDAQPNTLTLSFSGTMDGYTKSSKTIPLAALLSRFNQSKAFTLTMTIQQVQTSFSGLAAFVGLMNDAYGVRYAWGIENSLLKNYKAEWLEYGNSNYSSAYGDYETIKFIRTDDGTMTLEYYKDGTKTGGGTIWGLSGDLNIGFGILNANTDGTQANGSITAIFKDVKFETDAANCDTTSFN